MSKSIPKFGFFAKKLSTKKRIYLDYASTTPTDPRVLKAILPYLKDDFANPASLYTEGVAAKKAMDRSRLIVASFLRAHADEIIFTGSGTEANNLFLLGIFERAQKDMKKTGSTEKPHIITSSIEHSSVLEVCAEIERRGGEVTYVPVSEEGIVDPKEVKKALKENTALVSIHFANNEIGVIEPIKEIAKKIRHFRKQKNENGETFSSYPYFHTDASQAALYCDLHVETLGVDALTIDSMKVYGTKGVGAVYIKRGIDIEPIIFGGGQEKGLRSGTENVAGIVGFATALQIAETEKEKEVSRLTALRDWTIKEILALCPAATLNGHLTERLPNNINICFPGSDAEFLVFQLDARGIACSSVTSCKNLSEDSSSYVIENLGKNQVNGEQNNCTKSSLRLSLGRRTSQKEIKYLLKCLKELTTR